MFFVNCLLISEPDMFQSMGLQSVGQDLATEQHKRGNRGREEHTMLVKTKQLVSGKFYNQPQSL